MVRVSGPRRPRPAVPTRDRAESGWPKAPAAFVRRSGSATLRITDPRAGAFDIGGPLTELAQLANLATLVEGSIEYDTLSGKILNSTPASYLLHREYRKGWSL